MLMKRNTRIMTKVRLPSLTWTLLLLSLASPSLACGEIDLDVFLHKSSKRASNWERNDQRSDRVQSESNESNTPDAEPTEEAPPKQRTPLVEPLAAMSLEGVFKPLEKLPRKDSGVLQSSNSLRDPIFGTTDRKTVHWTAPNLAHRTLYFEEISLERWGHTHGPFVQPVISAGKFLFNAFANPWRSHWDQPCDLHYVVGLPHAGSCAPHIRETHRRRGGR